MDKSERIECNVLIRSNFDSGPFTRSLVQTLASQRDSFLVQILPGMPGDAELEAHARNDATKGVILRHGGSLPSGAYLKLNLYCAADDSGSSALSWELRRLMPAAGYELKAKNGQVKDICKAQKEDWARLFQLINIDLNDVYSDSFKCRLARGEAGDADADQEYSITTEGMLVLLAHWGYFRRSASDKLLARKVLGWIF